MEERIKILRNHLGLTQQKFADKLGLKRQTIAAYEIGNIKPSDSTLLLICKEFNVDENWLRTGKGEMFSADDEEYLFRWVGRVLKDKPESFKKRFLNFLSSLDDGDWEALEKIFNKWK